MKKNEMKPVSAKFIFENHSYEALIYKTHSNADILCDTKWIGSCVFKNGKLKIEDCSIFNLSEEDCERLILALETSLVIQCELLDIRFHLLGVSVSSISKQIYQEGPEIIA